MESEDVAQHSSHRHVGLAVGTRPGARYHHALLSNTVRNWPTTGTEPPGRWPPVPSFLFSASSAARRHHLEHAAVKKLSAACPRQLSAAARRRGKERCSS